MTGKRPRPDEELTANKKQKIDTPTESSLPRQPRRQQERSSDESHTSERSHTTTSSIFSRTSDASTATTAPGPSTPAPKMATNPATDPDSFECYYWGLRGNPRLLARSSSQPWTLPRTEEIGYDGNFEIIRKVISVVSRHPIRAKLDQGLRQNIRQVLASMEPCRWISVDYVRLGYDHEVEINNPVVVWVTVEENQVTLLEAQRIVDAMAQECMRADLPDVEVEMTEGRRTTNTDIIWGEQFPMPIQYPHIGSSIARKGSEGVGSLGGYVQIDGEIVGITNHHVAFGSSRLEAFPTADEESSQVNYTMLQPAERDHHDHITNCEAELDELTEEQIQEPSSSREEQIKKLQLQLEELKSWGPEMCLLGSVWKTSGVRARASEKSHRFRLDWALIKLGNPSRFLDPTNLVNKTPNTNLVNKTPNYGDFNVAPRQVSLAMKAAGQSKKRRDLPKYLKRGLALEETLNLQARAEEEDKKYVVWKFGRTTHYTFGVISGILSDYMSESGILSDELLVLDIDVFKSRPFSDNGDSGSFVWDSDGYVSGMLWGGKENSSQHYITPVQYLLEDIRQVCNAKEVRLVVRREDETDVVFGPPERRSHGGPAIEVGSPIDDVALADVLGAESE